MKLNKIPLNYLWGKRDYVLSHLSEITDEVYKCNLDIREIEHQAGRYLNMRRVVDEIITNHFKGDVVEFGTYKGLGLIMLARLFGANTTRRKFIGIDSFKGLPENSTIWRKGTFGDINSVKIEKEIKMRSPRNLDLKLINSWFLDPKVAIELHTETNNIVLFHFDADLKSSTLTALKIAEGYLANDRPSYFLFDDWGCHPDEVPDAFAEWIGNKKNLTVERMASTRFTRYYRIIKK